MGITGEGLGGNSFGTSGRLQALVPWAGPVQDRNRATEPWGLGTARDKSSQESSGMKVSKPESSMVNTLSVVSISSSPIPSSSVSCCAGWEVEDWRDGREGGFFQCQPFVKHNRFQSV